MTPFVSGATRDVRVFSISEALGRLAARIAGAVRREPRPEAFREFDPRKQDPAGAPRLVTPAHFLGAGGRAEIHRLPRD